MTHVHQLQDRISPALLRRIQLRVRPMLRPSGHISTAQQTPTRGDAGSYKPLSWRAETVRCAGLRKADEFETPLSRSEISYGIKNGLIAPVAGGGVEGAGVKV